MTTVSIARTTVPPITILTIAVYGHEGQPLTAEQWIDCALHVFETSLLVPCATIPRAGWELRRAT